MKVEELIESLPKLKNFLNEEESMLIPWCELEDRLKNVEPKYVKKVAKGMGLDCRFRGCGIHLIPK